MDFTGIGSVADLAKGIMDRFIPPKATEAERMQVESQLQQMLNLRESAILDTQKAVMVAEMGQEDKFTKRARPTVVYAGLAFVGLVYVVFPISAHLTGTAPPQLELPDLFWQVWGGVCSVWMIGRSAEKLGFGGSIVNKVTGKNPYH